MTISTCIYPRAALALLALALSACGGNACDRPQPFESASERGALRVPEDLSEPETTGKYDVPESGAGKRVRGPCADAPPLPSLASAASKREKTPAKGAALQAQPPSNAPAAAPTSAPGVPVAATPAPSGDLTADVQALVTAWMDAWRKADAPRYLAFYSARFEPPVTGERLAVWRAKREALLRDSGPVDVRFDRLRAAATAAGAQARFIQEFHNDGQISAVLKELDLVMEDGYWRILRERVAEVL